MFYKVQTTRCDSGTKWVSPYIFKSKKRAVEHAQSFDKFFGRGEFIKNGTNTYKVSVHHFTRIFKASLLSYHNKPEGIYAKKVLNDIDTPSNENAELAKSRLEQCKACGQAIADAKKPTQPKKPVMSAKDKVKKYLNQ